ncbi:metallophosphoesterase [Chryseobacterium sp. RG1]|uniref:Metallophosphoesterase n=1 Tax=Chryseobacterium tagetis TaxID=2801334 RepID=A0ABS8A5X9_9FLAO|nr:metallophosphoesterase [Chryseobacterium tagetis]MCA6069389.1 metallophosphoesterase [Chryseobacterium tagetis]
MIKFIHITDIHLASSPLDYKHERVLDALIKDLEFYLDNETILLFTGDFSDKFSISFNDFNNLIFKPILEKFPLLKNKIFFVPGNHDLNRKEISTTSIIIRNSLLTDENIRKNIYNDFTTGNPRDKIGLNEFEDFKNNFFADFNEKKNLSYFENNFIINLNNQSIGITCFNSSWLCFDNEDKGKLLLLENQIENSLNFINGCDIKIALMHHPLEFLHDSEQEKVQEKIQQEFDLVFLGHTHKQQITYNQSLLGNCYFSIGKSLNGLESDKNSYTNGYSIIELEPHKKIKVYLRKYNFAKNIFIDNSDYGFENGIFEIEINKDVNPIAQNELTVEESFNKYINDVGVNLTHKHKNQIKLDDIFIYPSLQEFNYKNDEKSQVISSIHLFNSINDDIITNHIILGDNSSGKTSLAKKLFGNILVNDNFYPILINGDEIKSTSPAEFLKLKERLLKEQYSCTKFPLNKKPFFIIDNFNESKLQMQYKKAFIDMIMRNDLDFVMFWDEFFTLNDVVDTLNERIRVFEILPFGTKNRFNLIKKWLDFDNDYILKEEEKVLRVYELEKLIDSIIGKNLVPSYPLFILTVLQTLELYPGENFEQSTQGHYYDVLIKSALGKKLTNNKEIEKYYTYLKELSYYIFSLNTDKLTEEQFIEFHNFFVQEFNLQRNGFVTMLDNLCETNILYKNADSYKFKYSYIYYYFLGKYFADNIDKSEIKSYIVELSENLYNSQNANIYLFLSHHSKSDFITETILKSAKGLFKEESILNFGTDVKEIDKLVTDKSQKLSLDLSKSHEDYKAEEIEKKEQKEEKELFDKKPEDTVDVIDYISEINKSFKTIEILGLILKNRYASLKTQPKETIAEEIYFLGLRTTSSVFKTLIDGEDFLVAEIINIIGEDKTISLHEKEDLAKKIIFNMYYMTAYSIIKRISTSVATKDLELTFNDIKKKHKTNNAIALIDISNRLEYSHKFPFNEVDLLKTQFKNNKFPYLIMRRLSFNYLRMFPMKETDQQKICEKLEIPIEIQRQIEMTSTTKKKSKITY